jgi:hypothetical protein
MLIELRDGDTIFVYNPAPGDSENTKILIDHLRRMAPGKSNVRVVVVDGSPFRIEVYRPSVAAEAEEHDGWYSFESAPMDGQIFDAWVMDGEHGNRRIPGVSFIKGVFMVHSTMAYEFRPIGEYGTPTHWRYPPQGPKT